MNRRTYSQEPADRGGRVASLALGVLALALGAVVMSSPLGPRAWADEAQSAFKIIVNPKNPARSIGQEVLARAFLKRTTRWDHGVPISPVDLPHQNPTRRAFSSAVLRRSVPAVRAYWLQHIFSGRSGPPIELDSDGAVVRYVSVTVGAVGYVSATANAGSTKEISVR